MLERAFNVENRFWTFANKLADIVLLELAWLLTSLPLVTIGAASTAFWHVLLQLAEDEEGKVLRTYFRMFRQSLLLGTKLWLSQLGLGLFLLLDVYLCTRMNGAVAGFLVGIFLILGVMWLLASMYLYPLAGRFDFSFRKIMSNSLFLGLRHLPHTFCMVLLIGAALAASYFIPYVIIFLPPLALYFNARICLWVFSLYMEKDGEDETEEDAAPEPGRQG